LWKREKILKTFFSFWAGNRHGIAYLEFLNEFVHYRSKCVLAVCAPCGDENV